MFFEDHDRFLHTSSVAVNPDRLNLRHEAIFSANRDLLAGARVLDIASHDGRWSLAALRSGAAHVVGVESRPDAVERAKENLAHYGAEESSYEFVTGDVFEVLADQKFDVDVVLCLGFFYHTYRHTELLARIRDLAPRHLIMDTNVLPGRVHPLVALHFEQPDDPRNATLDPFAHDGRTMSGWPSVPALRRMLEMYGFDNEFYDWPTLLDEHPGGGHLGDYRDGARVTVRATHVEAQASPADARWLSTAPESAGPDVSTRPVATPEPTPREDSWRRRVNQVLARTTGYQLSRAPARNQESH